ncbi:MAG: GspE/PulE family protein [Candidatus Pacebacteria bacterium]|nr:GspE/PulE family protein [Candidatus Paceibacterota bacterium]MDD5013291.1 GspE/PulE family protein [Candidatus Paceibacterota bacterium]MDD5752750.1 GspE/PulE family protein [Candidatus Paceibacterota bacterium]
MILIEKLIEKKIITPQKAEELKKEFNDFEGTEEDFYLIKKVISEAKLNELRSEFYGIEIFDGNEGLEIPNNILSLIPEESAVFYKVIPLRLKEDILEVGMLDPDDIKAKEAVNFITRQKRLKFKIYLIDKRLFNAYIKQYRNINEEVGKALSALETEIGGDENVELFSFDTAGQEKLSEEAPIIKMVAVILRHAVDGNASDIHIEPEEKQLRVRFRMDGTLYASLFLPLHTHPAIVARIKILSNLRIDENRIPQDGRFSARIDNKNIDFRVSTLPTKLGEKVVIRVLDPNEGLRSYQDIGLISNNLRLVKEAISKPFGMILATGPTGSGKTTTLYSILQELNKPEVNVVTLEDPIEYYVPGINQSQVRPEIGYDFSQGLRHVVRQDPDIIMVGEIRDEESASLATQAALTGHIVLSTLHTNNAVGVVPRLIDMKIKPFLLPATLNIGIAQRLAQRLCPFCKEKVRPHKEVEKMIMNELNLLPDKVKRDIEIPEVIYIYKAKGCPKCNNKGEKGRLGVFEVLKMTPELEKIIVDDPTELRIAEEAKRQGMITMRQDGIIKAINGDISIEEVLRVSEE